MIAIVFSLDEIENLEYRPVHIKGQFLHDRELYMGPRSLLKGGDAATQSSLVSKGDIDKTHGYLVITPFKLENREYVTVSKILILINLQYLYDVSPR